MNASAEDYLKAIRELLESIACCPLTLIREQHPDRFDYSITIVFHTEHGLFRWFIPDMRSISEFKFPPLDAVYWFRKCQQ